MLDDIQTYLEAGDKEIDDASLLENLPLQLLRVAHLGDTQKGLLHGAGHVLGDCTYNVSKNIVHEVDNLPRYLHIAFLYLQRGLRVSNQLIEIVRKNWRR